MSRFVACFSLAHLFLLPAYAKLGAIHPTKAAEELFQADVLAWWLMVVSAVIAPLMVGSVLYLLDGGLHSASSFYRQKLRSPLIVLSGAIAAISILNAVLVAEPAWRVRTGILLEGVGAGAFLLIAFLAVGTLVLLVVRGPAGPIARAVAQGLRVLSPMAAFSLAGILYLGIAVGPREEAALGGRTSAEPTSKVIVLLFDALSYGAVIDSSGVRPELRNLSKVAEESLVFHDYSASSGGTTRHNIPVLLTGQQYRGNPVHDRVLGEVARATDGRKVPLRMQRNLFDVAREKDFDVFVIGAYLRYCSTYVRQDGYCTSTPFQYPLVGASPTRAVLAPLWLSVASALPHRAEVGLQRFVGGVAAALFDESAGLRRQLGKFHLRVKEVVQIPGRTFVYVHYPLPHHPYMTYHAETGLFSADSRYSESVRSLDLIVGELRNLLVESGDWDSTLLVLLSDHPLAAAVAGSDPRVPLLIKLPSALENLEQNTPSTHSDLLPLLESTLSSWLPATGRTAAVKAVSKPN